MRFLACSTLENELTNGMSSPSEQSPYQVLLYYFYTNIEDPKVYRDSHFALCEELGLKGRILVSKEGLNGTVSGATAACQRYRDTMDRDPLTQGMEWKIDSSQNHVFPKLSVKVRSEIVTLDLGEEDFSPIETTGNYLSPEDWREAMKDPNTVIIDARNDYEWKVGHFKNAILPPLRNFREFPQWIRDHRGELEGKKILTYCTGGIRCEKFSGFLVREGFEDVNQLHGGIVTYGKNEQTRGEDFEGECYVFDERVKVPVNSSNPKVIGRCVYCGCETERYVNCAEKHECNEQHFCCEDCAEEYDGYCSTACKDFATKKREGLISRTFSKTDVPNC